MAQKAIYWEIRSEVSPIPGRFAREFVNADVIFTAQYAQHINTCHVNACRSREKSRFKSLFNLTSTLAMLTKQTFFSQGAFVIDKAGFNHKHGQFRRYVFNCKKIIGCSQDGKPCSKIAVFYSYWPNYGDKFKTISAYPCDV